MLLKHKIRKILETGYYKDFNYYWNKIDKFDYVSFDLFDTLIKRIVKSPKDIFMIIENKYNIKDFYIKRVAAEKKAELKYSEPTLNDIYNELEINKNRKNAILKLELDEELNSMYVNTLFFNLFTHCVNCGKKVIITTDTYFSSDFIIKILNKFNISGYYEIYNSCCTKYSKKTGKMYSYILNKEKISSSNIIHIGDSIKQDFLSAIKSEIKSILIPKYVKNNNFKFNTEDNYKINYLNKFLTDTSISKDYFYKFGYERFGPFLYFYSKWLLETANENKINKIYFFSRDGWIMKKIFDSINKDKKIESFYLEVSRRSLRVPILWLNPDIRSIVDMLSSSKILYLKSFFEDIGLDINDYLDLIDEFGFNKNTFFEAKEILSNQNFVDLYEKIKPDMINNSKAEYKNLVDYIKQNDLCGKFMIVDIGWAGSMQRYLKSTLDLLKIKNEIIGCYVGIADYYKKNIINGNDLNMFGYLFDFKNNKNDLDKRRSFVGLFETLFLEQGGSVKKYYKKDNLIKAERFKYEYIQNGKPTIELSSVEKIQNGALDFSLNFSLCDNLTSLSLSANDVFTGIERIGTKPCLKDVKQFGDFKFLDEGIVSYLAKPRSIFYYSFNISKLKLDFITSRWKVGFLKRLFKIHISYDKIYKFLLKYK